MFDTNSIILEAPYLALYDENSTDVPLWSKGLLFSTTIASRSIGGVTFNTNGNYIDAHSFNSDNINIVLTVETATGKLVSARSYTSSQYYSKVLVNI